MEILFLNNQVRECYVSPSCKVFRVHTENAFMIVSNGVNWADNNGESGGNDSYDDGDDY